MQSPPCTTVAGRHAAQLARDRGLAALTGDQFAALETLAGALRRRPLQVVADLTPREHALPQIACKVRLEYLGLDYVWIDATLHELGWRPDPTALSRFNGRYEFRVLVHRGTGTRVSVTITLPEGRFEHWEAA